MRNPDICKSSEIGSEPEQTPLSSEVKKLSKEKFQKEILALLYIHHQAAALESLFEISLLKAFLLQKSPLGEKSVEGFLLRSCEEGESESILFSDLTILQACGKLLIKNKTDTSSITEKLYNLYISYTMTPHDEEVDSSD
ncbi:hypothetical protein ACTFIR_003907 [Dictyostelium discoideum]